MTAISDLLSSVQIGEPRRLGRLDVFALFAPASSAGYFMLLDEALAAKSVEVTETSDAGSVPVLKLASTAAVPILLIDGEELVGAKQNRILNVSVLAPPGQDILLPVSCVERGRWRYNSRTFGTADHALFAKARARKAERMVARKVMRRAAGDGLDAYSVAESFGADQGAVWSDVSDKLGRMKVRSASSAMKDGYDSYEINLREFEEQLSPQPGQTGAAFALDGKIVGIELLATESAFRTVFRKLVRSYAFDALEDAGSAAAPAPVESDVKAFLVRIAASGADAAESVGLGEDVRIQGEGCAGHALVHGNAVFHLAAFDQSLAA